MNDGLGTNAFVRLTNRFLILKILKNLEKKTIKNHENVKKY